MQHDNFVMETSASALVFVEKLKSILTIAGTLLMVLDPLLGGRLRKVFGNLSLIALLAALGASIYAFSLAGTAFSQMPEVVAAAPHIFGVPIIFNILAVFIVTVITIVLVWGIRESASFNFWMVAIKLVVLGFFVLVCFKYVKPANWHPFAPNGFHGIVTGAAIVFFAYIGFDAVSTTAEECRDPKRDMPIGIIGSLVVCTLIYAIIAAVFTGLIPYDALVKTLSTEQAEPLTLAMKFVSMPNWMVGVVAFGSVVAHTAVLLVFQLGQPRIFYSMARDGLLPPWAAKIHPKYKTPHVTTIITGVFVGAFSAFMNINEGVELTNIGTLWMRW